MSDSRRVRLGTAARIVLAGLGLSALCGGLALRRAGAADDLTGRQILRKVDRDNRARDERSVVEMVLVTRDGRRQRRTLETLFKAGVGDDDMHLLRFLSPSTIRGMGLLTLEQSTRPDDQWIYLPALHKSKKIAASKRTNRFAETDFTYEDLRTEDFTRNTYKRLPDSTLDGAPCFVVEARPRNRGDSGYSKRLVYVEKRRFITLKVEYYDRQGRHQKTLLNRGYQRVHGLWRAREAMMADRLRGSKTLWRCTKRTIDAGIPTSTFTVGSLERGL